MTSELDSMWEDNSIELKDKIDRYGYTLEDLKASIDIIKQRKKERDSRTKQAIDRIEQEMEHIKTRLNYFCDNKPLRGNEYSFHPFNSTVADKVDIAKVGPEFGSYTIAVNNNGRMLLMKALESFIQSPVNKEVYMPEYELLKLSLAGAERKVNMSDLPAGHPAIKFNIKPSVRMR